MNYVTEMPRAYVVQRVDASRLAGYPLRMIRGLPRWTGERTLVIRGELEVLTYRQYKKRCGEIRRIWIKVIDETADGERIDFGADELTLVESVRAEA